MFKILFVCTGNICRSPLAEGVMRHILRRDDLHDSVMVDSAGTHAYHVGEPPDRRAIAAAGRRGIDLSGQVARNIGREDFTTQDLIVALDEGHYHILHRMQPTGGRAELRMMLEFAPQQEERDVPDPYFGGDADFEHALDLIVDASEGLLERLPEYLDRQSLTRPD